MAECKYKITRVLDGVEYPIFLTRDEISAIWVYYDDVLIEERIEEKLRNDYGFIDLTGSQELIDNLLHKYNKNRGYGCDEEFSLNAAFEDHSEEIEKLM